MEPHTIQVKENGKTPIPTGLPPSDLCRIQESFQILRPQIEEFVRRFYEVLFEKYPDLQRLFPSGNLSGQQSRFQNGLTTLISHLEHPQELRTALIQLGQRHQAYGITIHHYPPVVDTFLHVLIDMGGGRVNGQTYVAWANFLHLIRAIMLEPYAPGTVSEGQQRDYSGAINADKPKRILLIDDDHQLLDLYQSYLEKQGYFCSQISDVTWAFTHLHMSRYDLVLTDFQMPGMNGIQLRIHLSRLGSGLCPPFLLVTGKPNQEIRKLALESGFVTVLKKPHVLTELGSVVRTVLENP
jgi:CheY-like chemotaxis protein/hemoglobin-like flavoprotein